MYILYTLLLQAQTTPSGELGWSTLLPILNGIVGGTVMALVAWLVGTGKLTLGRETQGFKDLWMAEKTARESLEKDRDKLVDDLRRNNEVLIESASASMEANNALTAMNKQLQELLKVTKN